MHLSSVRRGRRDRSTGRQTATVLPPPTSIALRHPTAETYAAVRARVMLARPAAYPTFPRSRAAVVVVVEGPGLEASRVARGAE
jgi:hypothetical protein